jgi:DNA replication protein DnaC
MNEVSITKPKTTTTATTTGATTSARLGLMLTDLRLPTVKRLAGDLCAQSDLEGWPAHRFLEALLEHEINERERRRIDRHRHDSGLGSDKRLSSFDFAAVPSVSKAQVMALSEGTEWLDRGANVLLFGPPGVGKSHLVSALGVIPPHLSEYSLRTCIWFSTVCLVVDTRTYIQTRLDMI